MTWSLGRSAPPAKCLRCDVMAAWRAGVETQPHGGLFRARRWLLLVLIAVVDINKNDPKRKRSLFKKILSSVYKDKGMGSSFAPNVMWWWQRKGAAVTRCPNGARHWHLHTTLGSVGGPC